MKLLVQAYDLDKAKGHTMGMPNNINVYCKLYYNTKWRL